MAKNIFVVEGEVEEKFLKETKNRLKTPAKVEKCNVLQRDIPKKIQMMKYDNVYFVFDIDVLKNYESSKGKCDQLKKNLKMVSAGHKYLLLQCDSFEDELIRNMDGVRGLRDLCNIFNCKSCSEDEFKKKFIKANNMSGKLSKIAFINLYSKGKENYSYVKSAISKSFIKDGKFIFRKK